MPVKFIVGNPVAQIRWRRQTRSLAVVNALLTIAGSLALTGDAVGAQRDSARDAQAVVLAYIHALQRGDWTAACSLQNRDVLAADQSSVAKCARIWPSSLNDGNGFGGFIRRGTAIVREARTQLSGAGRARVYVLWRVYPWRRDAVLVYFMDREYTYGQHGLFRISDQEWGKKWPP